MELGCDWIGYQNLFYPRAKALVPQEKTPNSEVFLLIEGGSVLEAYAEDEDLSDWLGAPLSEIRELAKNRVLLTYERKQVEGWLEESHALGQFHEQLAFLRASAAGDSKKGHPQSVGFEPHFLIRAFDGWWKRLLPSTFGLYIRLDNQLDNRVEGRPNGGGAFQEFLIVIKKGKPLSFHRPDLNYLGPERRRQPAEVVKYLSEKYLIPIQAAMVPAQDWAAWTEQVDPWKQVHQAFKHERAKLYPKGVGLSFLLGTRRYWKI